MPLRKALAKVSQSAGVPIRVAPQLRDVVVVLSANDVPVDVLLNRVAKEAGFRSSWTGTEYVFDRPPELQKELQAAWEVKVAKDWADAMQERRKVLEANPWSMETAKRATQPRPSGGEAAGASRTRVRLSQLKPAARLVFRALDRLGPSAMTQAGSFGRIVYSRYPTAMQKPLPGFEELVQTYVRESALTGSTPGSRTPSFGGLPSWSHPVGKVHLEISSFGQWAMANVTLFDTTGKAVDRSLFLPSQRPTPLPVETRSIVDSLKPFKPSALALELAQFVGTSGEEEERVLVAGQEPMDQEEEQPVQLSPALQSVLLNPEEHDPLALLPGEAVLQVAKQRGKSLVAVLPDALVSTIIGPDEQGMLDLQRICSAILEEGVMVLAQDQRFVTLSPKHPLLAEIDTADRGALGKLIRAANAGKLDLNAALSFWGSVSHRYSIEGALDTFPALAWLTLENRYSRDPTSYQGPTLRFLSLLNSAQKQQLASQQGLRLSNLLPNQRTLLSELVFVLKILSVEAEEGPATAVIAEPTEAFPTGLLGNGVVQLQAQQIQAWGSSEANMLSLRQIAAFQVYGEREVAKPKDAGAKEDEDQHHVSDMLADLKLYPVQVSAYRIRMSLGDGQVHNTEFKFIRGAIGAKPLPLAQLRREVLAQLDALRRQLRELDDEALGEVMGESKIAWPDSN